MPDKRRPPHKGRTIRDRIVTTATPEQLWEAWADPARLAEWFADRAEGHAVEGGILTWYFDRFGYALPYEIYSAVPGEHLVLTGELPGRPRFFLEIEIRREGGTTVLELTNSGFLDASGWDEEYEGIVSGWRMSLATLKLYVERFFGHPRSQFFAMQPATFEYAELLPFYRDPSRLALWLTENGSVGSEGEPYGLTLRGGMRATGEVLAVTGWEVQLSWKEISGTLALKGFAMGPGARAICIHGSGWGMDAAGARGLEKYFGEALERLAPELARNLIRQGSERVQ